MRIRKATPDFLYANLRALDWARMLSSLLDESLAALCIRQWQRVPVTNTPRSYPGTVRRRK